jgi:hypothetical protein
VDRVVKGQNISDCPGKTLAARERSGSHKPLQVPIDLSEDIHLTDPQKDHHESCPPSQLPRSYLENDDEDSLKFLLLSYF